MCVLESELESQLGEFHIRMKGNNYSSFLSFFLLRKGPAGITWGYDVPQESAGPLTSESCYALEL